MKKHKLIYFEWADATEPTGGWCEEENLKKWAREDNYWVAQCGWIIEENKEYILIASQKAFTTSVEGTTPLQQLAQYIKIPKTFIRKRKEIKI